LTESIPAEGSIPAGGSTPAKGSIPAEGSTPPEQRVWDLPLRLFHWSLALLVTFSLYTGINGGFTEMDYHMLSGYGILTLVIFRVIWGFVGSTHSRFRSFINLSGLLPYIRQLVNKEQTSSTGHNPLGALSIVIMLFVLGTQATSGLFANDDMFMEGPLVHLVGDATSDTLTTVHHFCAKALYGLIGLHLAAIIFHELYKRDRLVLPMISGYKKGLTTPADKPSLIQESVNAATLLAVCVGFVYWLVHYV
jgi:cytochrome b